MLAPPASGALATTSTGGAGNTERLLPIPWSAATAQGADPATPNPWPCRLIPASPSVRSLIDNGIERSETIRRQCQELAAALAIAVIEWGVRARSRTQKQQWKFATASSSPM